MMPGPQLYVDSLTREGYHPRCNKHGERLSQLVLADLLAVCTPLADAAASGKVVYATDFDVYVSDPQVTAALPPRPPGERGWDIYLAKGAAGAAPGGRHTRRG